jgi:hypothetical protein
MMRLNTKLEMNASRDGRVDGVVEVLVAMCLDIFLGRETSCFCCGHCVLHDCKDIRAEVEKSRLGQ